MAPPITPVSHRTPVTKSWDPKEILQAIDEKLCTEQTPYFRLDVKAIRDKRKPAVLSAPSDTPERPSKQAKYEESRAKCALTIWEGQGVSPPLLVQDTVGCVIRPQMDAGGARYAKIELDRPLRAYCQDLQPKSGRPPTAQRFSMQITLQADGMETPWPPVSLNKIPEPVSGYFIDGDNSKVKFPLLVTTYSRFPHCPSEEDEALLGLTVTQDGKQYKPRLNLQIDARWVVPESREDTYSSWRDARSKHALSSPAVAKNSPQHLEPEPDLSKLRIKTIWQMQHHKIQVSQHRFDGLVCPLCEDPSAPSNSWNRTFTNPNVYVLHLISEHDIFKFKPIVKYKEGNPLIVSVKIAVDIKNTYETGQDGTKSGEGENFHRIKGTRGVAETLVLRKFDTFFNLQEYLKSDESKHWKKSKSKDRTGRLDHRGHSNVPGSRSDSAFDSSARATPAALADLTRPAKLVPDLPLPRRKKYPVPAAPDGVVFFSLRVKRPLSEGELLSESDDDIDNDWLSQKHEARIESFDDLTTDEKSFMKRHDRHMLKENVNNNLHYREALIRFCRINAKWLKRPNIRREFAKKLAALQLEGVVKMPQIFECMSIIDDAVADDETDVDTKHGQGRDDVPNSATRPTGRLYSRCAVCNDPIRSLTDIVRCANSSCLNDCHLDCCEALFGAPASSISEAPAACRGCKGQREKKPSAALTARSVNAVDTAANSGNHSGPIASQRSTRREAASRAKSGANQEDPLVIDSDADTASLEALYPTAPDPLSRLPNGKRATTPRYIDPLPATSTPSPLPAGAMHGPYAPTATDTFARPSLPDVNDFPVGRDMSRLGKGVGQGTPLQSPFSPDATDSNVGGSGSSAGGGGGGRGGRGGVGINGTAANGGGDNDLYGGRFERDWRSASSPRQPAAAGESRLGAAEVLASMSASPRMANSRRPFGDLLSYDKT